VRYVPAPRRRRKKFFDRNVQRRAEIIRHARDVGAAQTDDFDRWLIAWVWHNPLANDQVWSLMNAADRMGGRITEERADRIIKEAATGRKWMRADALARWLGLTLQQRTRLKIRTIGARDFSKRERTMQRKHKG
jgi:hypothetical protein